ncbi:MAG: hypothetical protein RDV48_04480 [Candidatus Eremiobacteraeota bacterium]|nr:hypothetical protein [Candidatus Eremiobacteraeota bacterium]
MIVSENLDKTENPSHGNDTMSEAEETRAEKIRRSLEFNKLIEQSFQDFYESGSDNGRRHYDPGDRDREYSIASKIEAIESLLEEKRCEMRDLEDYAWFRGGFLAGIEYAKAGGDICQK